MYACNANLQSAVHPALAVTSTHMNGEGPDFCACAFAEYEANGAYLQRIEAAAKQAAASALQVPPPAHTALLPCESTAA